MVKTLAIFHRFLACLKGLNLDHMVGFLLVGALAPNSARAIPLTLDGPPNPFCIPRPAVQPVPPNPQCAVLRDAPPQFLIPNGAPIGVRIGVSWTNSLGNLVFGGELTYPVGNPPRLETQGYGFVDMAKNRWVGIRRNGALTLPFDLKLNEFIIVPPPVLQQGQPPVEQAYWKPFKQPPVAPQRQQPGGGLRLLPLQVNVDYDSIPDKISGVGNVFAFDLWLDPINTLNEISIIQYVIQYDATELEYVDFVAYHPHQIDGCSLSVSGCTILQLLSSPISQSEPSTRLATLSFRSYNPDEWPGDGIWDIRINNIIYTDTEGLAHTIDTQDIEFEVQMQEVPGPLPILGVSVVLSYARRLRKLSKELYHSSRL
jgi:hypothetical protein